MRRSGAGAIDGCSVGVTEAQEPAAIDTNEPLRLPTDPALLALRDMFAAHALAGMLPAPKVPGVLPMNVDGTARMAYAYADAMLRARLLPPKPPEPERR